MALTLLALAGALAIFVWVFFPIFGSARQIAQGRPYGDAREAVSKSVQELRTDLELNKIQQDDLDHIKAFLEEESSK
jgi:hypothetical protein